MSMMHHRDSYIVRWPIGGIRFDVMTPRISRPLTQIFGILQKSSSYSLKNIFLVPKITQNLLSIHQFAIGNHCSLTYDSHGCVVKEKWGGQFSKDLINLVSILFTCLYQTLNLLMLPTLEKGWSVIVIQDILHLLFFTKQQLLVISLCQKLLSFVSVLTITLENTLSCLFYCLHQRVPSFTTYSH